MVEIIYYQEAKKEIKEAAAYYEEQQKGLGQNYEWGGYGIRPYVHEYGLA